MAHLNGVTERALRLYQKKGILEPEYINPETGFRYYDIRQSMKLDMLVQLQGLGLSLDEIAQIVSQQDMGLLRQRASERLDALNDQLREVLEARAAAQAVVNSCDAFFDPPILNQVLLERLPERKILRFKIDHPEMTRRHSGSDVDLQGEWEYALRTVKQEMLRRGYSPLAFNNVGCIVPQDGLGTVQKYVEYAFVTVDEAFADCLQDAETIPASQCLTFYTKYVYDAEGNEAESVHLERMLDYARAKNLEVAGDFYDDVLCRYQQLLRGDGVILCRYSLPVRQGKNKG